MTNYKIRKYKTALNRMKHIDSWFWCRYSLNPYQGCEHACIYCDARSKRYYLQDDFEEKIIVKKDIDKVLENQILGSKRFERDVVAMGGVCDSYAPVELKYKNTQKVLKVLEKHGFPLGISTKSTNIERDLSLLNRIAQRSWCNVAFTITSFDEEVVNFLEPNASPPKERIEVLKKIKENYPSIQTGINLMPIIPYLEDTRENLETIFKKAQEANVDYILHAPGLTLRDIQKDFFIDRLKKEYPNILDKLLSLYVDGIEVNREYAMKISQIALELYEKYQISMRAKRWIPEDYRKYNYLIAENLLNNSYKKQITGKPYKQEMWAGFYVQNLKESIINLKNSGKIPQRLRNNTQFLEELNKYQDVQLKGTLDKFF